MNPTTERFIAQAWLNANLYGNVIATQMEVSQFSQGNAELCDALERHEADAPTTKAKS